MCAAAQKAALVLGYIHDWDSNGKGPRVMCRSRLRGQREKLLRRGQVVAALRTLLPERGSSGCARMGPGT
jgi:hypothetical protein